MSLKSIIATTALLTVAASIVLPISINAQTVQTVKEEQQANVSKIVETIEASQTLNVETLKTLTTNGNQAYIVGDINAYKVCVFNLKYYTVSNGYDSSTGEYVENCKADVTYSYTAPKENITTVGAVSQANQIPETVLNANVATITAGKDFTIALTKEGNLIGWGENTKVSNIPAGLTNVKKVVAGKERAVVLTNEGQVVTWGDISDGNQAYIPATVPNNLPKVKDIAVGETFTSVLTEDGKVITFGIAPQSILPMGTYTSIVATKKQIAAISTTGQAVTTDMAGNLRVPNDVKNSKIVKLVAGGDNIGVIKEDGTSFFWGGNVKEQNQHTPTFLNNQKLVDIVAGDTFNAAITASGKVFAWGDSANNADKIPFFLSDGNKTALSISSANDILYVLTK